MEILVARQPVFDRHERLFGYDVMLRRAGVADPGDGCPEELFVNAILGLGLDRLAGGARAFITVDHAMLMEGSVQLLPADRIVAQLVGETAEDERVIESCDALLWKGYRIAVAPNDPRRVPARLLRAADIVKVNIGAVEPGQLPDLARWLRGFHVRMLATNVRHRAERDVCTELGFELFSGYRFSAPETLSRQDLPVQHVLTFRVLKLVRDATTSDVDVENLLRRDVALSYKLLRMVNSAAFGGRDIWSIGHALRLL
ncbi:MAG TPA: HDOD domain-containing protein, partial [Gemmatimonadaceae bacterium]|nr:HDOD domain-containing protein [Gemmatimonadaceae bacterium]